MLKIWSAKKKKERVKLGIVANEFFDLSLGRMGGFGILTRQVAQCFKENPELGVDVVFLSGDHELPNGKTHLMAHDTPLIPLKSGKEQRSESKARIKAEGIDLLFTICFRPNFRSLFRLLPRTPILVWIQDPRTLDDAKKILNIRVPGMEHIQPPGLKTPDCTSMNSVARTSKWFRRKIVYGTPATFLPDKAWKAYGMKAQGTPVFLPYMVDIELGDVRKSEKPRVVFLGRLDPYKRPWLFAELAQHFPEVEFLVLGQPHFDDPAAGVPTDWPKNVRVLGHVDGNEKRELLGSSWVLINTSSHEGLPVSFVEALKCETPILSSVNPEDVVSRFGIYVGRFDGTGKESIPSFVEGLTRLLHDRELRTRLGKEGRDWASKTHCKTRFLEGFYELGKSAGVL